MSVAETLLLLTLLVGVYKLGYEAGKDVKDRH